LTLIDAQMGADGMFMAAARTVTVATGERIALKTELHQVVVAPTTTAKMRPTRNRAAPSMGE
jgi:hypothetical protein